MASPARDTHDDDRQEAPDGDTVERERPAKKQKKASSVNVVRVAMAEMRKLREQDALTCAMELSSGQTVGEFLLEQWLLKEGRRK